MGHAQKTASRATCRAYSSVILVPLTGPVGSDCAHSGDGGKGCGLSAYASGSAANTVSAAVPANRIRFIVVSFDEVESGSEGNALSFILSRATCSSPSAGSVLTVRVVAELDRGPMGVPSPMSALGQKLTYSNWSMSSALLSIADEQADISHRPLRANTGSDRAHSIASSAPAQSQ